MATRTDNLKLSKAETSDGIKSTLTANNQNFDKLDGVITRLKNNQLQGTASGTEIVIQDSAEMESVLELSGNSEQDSRTGKNLLKKGSEYVTKTSCGITFTVNKDESVTINGTNDGTGNSALYLWNSSGTPLTIKTGYYRTRKTGHNQVTIIAYDGTTNEYTTIASNERDSVTVVNDMSCTQIYLQVAKGTTTTFNNFTVYPILTQIKDSVEPYEPYGLKPSPEFESPIMSVKSKSDNLFDISKKSDNTSFTWASGADYEATGAVRSDYIPVDGIKEISSNYKFNISFHDKDKKYLGNGEDVTTASHPAFYSMIMPNNSNIAYFRVAYRPNPIVSANPTDMTTVTDIMLNAGSTALPYQKFGYVPVEVKVAGKNKAEIKASGNVYITDGVCSQGTADTKTDMQWKVEGRLEGKFVKSFASYVDNSLGFKTCSFVKDDSFDRLYLGLNGSTRDTLIYIPVDDLINGETYTVQWNVLNATQGSVSWNNVQLEKGATATPFVSPPKTISLPLGDIELRSTPDGTRDTFAKVDGVWNKVSNIGVLECKSTFNYDNQGGKYDTETRMMFSLNAGNRGVDRKFNTRSLCNYFTETIHLNSAVTVQNASVDVTAFNFHHLAGYENYLYFKLERSLLETQDATGFQKWLSENPTEVTYVLATPIYTPITDTALSSALDELEQLVLHEGYNYITATGVNNVKAYLDLSYYKDINIVLDNINASILSLGGGINV